MDVYDDSIQFEQMARLVKGKGQKVMISVRHELELPMREFVDGALRNFGYVDLCRYPVGDGGNLKQRTLEEWDVLRKAKAAGNIRAIGISTHEPEDILACMKGLEGLDFAMFPYNFIHARVSYGGIVPAALKQGVALIAIKPLGAGSIVRLDPRRARPKASLEREDLFAAVPVGRAREQMPLLEEAAAKLKDELDRSPDETLPQAALRFVYSKPFL